MKKQLLALSAAAMLAVPAVAGAEGFGINEWTAEGVAMGGARMFADNDPGNVAYNPASITKVKGEAMKNSFTYISPHGKYKLYDKNGAEIESGSNVVHAGWAPGAYYVKQLNEKDWFGVGTFARFAMVSEFERSMPGVSSNAFFSKLNGISLTPVYAHKFDNKWSGAVGAEINYVGLELQKNAVMSAGEKNIILGGTQTEGESYALGWNAAANYAFDDKNEVGVVYRSKIKHSMEADFRGYYSQAAGGHKYADAYGEVTLPDSWALGYSHKFDDKTRVELNGTYTKWSTYDALNMHFNKPYDPTGTQTISINEKNWDNGWRYAIGVEHKLSPKYTLMAGFAYDESVIPYDGGDFIVPTGERRTYSIGARYNDDKQALAVALGYIDIGGLNFKGHGTDAFSEARTRDNYAKMFSISYERHF